MHSLPSALPMGIISVGVPALFLQGSLALQLEPPRPHDDIHCLEGFLHVIHGHGGFQEKWLVWGNIMMTVRFSTELNLSLGPSVRSFPVKRFGALYNLLCLDGIKDNHGQVSLWPLAGKSALTAAFATNQAWSLASEVAAYFRINYFQYLVLLQGIDGCTTLIY